MKTYPLTPSGFDALRTKLLTLGVTLSSDTDGTLTYQGIELKYHYDPSSPVVGSGGTILLGVLTLSIEHKPIFVPASMIWEQVDKWILG